MSLRNKLISDLYWDSLGLVELIYFPISQDITLYNNNYL